MLIMLFAVMLGWLPSTGPRRHGRRLRYPVSFLTLDGLSHLILPAINLALFNMSLVIRLTRAGVREALLQDYVKFARAKGLSQRRIVFVHVLKNIMIPVVTVLGLEFGTLIAFAVVTETVFAWPGMGKLLIDSIQAARPAGDRRLPDDHRLHLHRHQSGGRHLYSLLDPAGAPVRTSRHDRRSPTPTDVLAETALDAAGGTDAVPPLLPRFASRASWPPSALPGGLVLIVFIALFAPWIAPQDPYDLAQVSTSWTAPAARRVSHLRRQITFWLGTDGSRPRHALAIFYGLRISLGVGDERTSSR